ncbi:MAG: hypothetical protein K0R59_2819 [Sphingobacterium sp.]|jgi:hypothetical protein|uniref:hypothetical protein n=1 Tax=unclassified Sphingobacterium TaxID=2609468 RepID=UPI000986FD7E|nr:hypothetical protein [Sphingobacterium sp. CZ-UAM]MDF2517523.1 hypothetical protein [Sphingobacterium sp.]OOG17356.1 hypothetical protein BWD42_14165 [Sphingobacterium sp. CZ-UAM]
MNFLKSIPLLICAAVSSAYANSTSDKDKNVQPGKQTVEKNLATQGTVKIVAGATLRLNNNTAYTLTAGVQLWRGNDVINLSFPSAPWSNILYENIPEGTYSISVYGAGMFEYEYWIPQLGEKRTGNSDFYGIQFSADKPLGIFCSIKSGN